MADSSGDPPVNGAIEVQQDTASVSRSPEGDSAATDSGQRASDRDQTASGSDQAAADIDQTASDRDQAASDRDLAQGGDPVEHDLTRDVRDRATRQREQSAQRRVATARTRDALGEARDLEGRARDEAAAQRDRELAERDATWAAGGHPMSGAEVVLRAGAYRKQAAADRVAAAEFRARAAADREQAARDREQAARERREAQADRDALLQQLTIAETDQLTGARVRSAGLNDLEHEIDRARRTTGRLAVGYIDIVGLKAVNDARGHAAGDALLSHAVEAIRAHLRSYDLIIRLGGDEFLCTMSDATIDTAVQRFGTIQTALATDPDPCMIRVGVAALTARDTVTELIEHADAALPPSTRR